MVIIPNGVFFLILIPKPQQESNLSWTKNKIVQAEENSKMNMAKQNYWTIEQLLSFYDSLWVTLTVIKSYIIYHIYLFRQVYSCNNKGFTIDMWNFKIQNNLFFIASFTRGMTYKWRICCWQELAKNLRLCHQAPLFLSVVSFST